jgi:hypothetical protein
MRTAVIITGQERSFFKIFGQIRTNLLEPNNSTVFLACETINPEALVGCFAGIELGGVDVRTESFRSPDFKAFLEVLHSGSRPALLEKVFERSRPEPWHIGYVLCGASVLQYYQVLKAWLMVLEYEQTHKMRFDVVVRWRPDALITEKLDLSALLSSDELTCRSLGNERIRRSLVPTGQSTDRVVVTLGTEQTWFAKRDVFALLGPMMYMYGAWDNGSKYAFNSETFFQAFCDMNHITHWGFHEDPIFNEKYAYITAEVTSDPQLFSIVR